MSDLDSLMNSFFVAGCLQATHIKLPFALSAKQSKGGVINLISNEISGLKPPRTKNQQCLSPNVSFEVLRFLRMNRHEKVLREVIKISGGCRVKLIWTIGKRVVNVVLTNPPRCLIMR